MNRFFSYLLSACFVLVLFSCQKEYSFENDTTSPASGSLWDSAGVCLPDSVHGTFYGGIRPGSDTAFVEVQVNVTQTGAYNIVSDQQDGFYFADSGFFSNTGINTIKLKPVGIPIIPTTSIFTITFDSSFCSFEVVINDSTGTGLGGDTLPTDLGDWQFTTDSGGDFHGKFAYVALFPDSTLPGFYDLGFNGFTNDTSLVLVVLMPSSIITPGTYYSQPVGGADHGNCYMGFGDTTTLETIYSAAAYYPDSINFAITISSYDPVTKVVKGTLSGNALIEKYYDEGKAVKIDGSFTATVP